MYRHHPQTKIASDFVRSGALGQISHAWGTFTFALEDNENVRWFPEMGGGSLWDIGIYPLSLAQFLMGGPPIEVFGMQQLGETGVDETFTGQLRYPGGKFAQISSSFRCDYNNRFELVGNKGRLVLTRPFNKMELNRRLVFYPEDGKSLEIPVPCQHLYIGEIEDMVAAVLDGTEPYLTLEETRSHIRTVLALYESAQTGLPVKM